jgi:hypothetical protein
MQDPDQGVAEVEPTLLRLKKYFATGATKLPDWRKKQLKQLILGIKELESEFIEAYKQDHGRDAIIFKLQESNGVIEPAEHDLRHIDQWIAPINEHVEAIMTPARN